MSAVVLGSRILMMTAANRFGLYSAFLACKAMCLRSSFRPREHVETTFCSWGTIPEGCLLRSTSMVLLVGSSLTSASLGTMDSKAAGLAGGGDVMEATGAGAMVSIVVEHAAQELWVPKTSNYNGWHQLQGRIVYFSAHEVGEGTGAEFRRLCGQKSHTGHTVPTKDMV